MFDFLRFPLLSLVAYSIFLLSSFLPYFFLLYSILFYSLFFIFSIFPHHLLVSYLFPSYHILSDSFLFCLLFSSYPFLLSHLSFFLLIFFSKSIHNLIYFISIRRSFKAQILQNSYRSYTARMKLTIKKKEKAAIKIQCLVRTVIARTKRNLLFRTAKIKQIMFWYKSLKNILRRKASFKLVRYSFFLPFFPIELFLFFYILSFYYFFILFLRFIFFSTKFATCHLSTFPLFLLILHFVYSISTFFYLSLIFVIFLFFFIS